MSPADGSVTVITALSDKKRVFGSSISRRAVSADLFSTDPDEKLFGTLANFFVFQRYSVGER